MSRASIVLFIAVTALASKAPAAPCVPPQAFVDTPHPSVAPVDELVSHTEEIVIERPLSLVLKAVQRPLRDAIHHPGSLPGVVGEYDLPGGEFGAPGSRRMVCLSDGSTLEEQVLERVQNAASYQFRYVVWNFTSPAARPIDYAVGKFVYTGTRGQTRIVWTYAFQLKRDRFPGYLGSFGNFLFRIGFVDRQWADLMRQTLDGFRQDAASEPPSGQGHNS